MFLNIFTTGLISPCLGFPPPFLRNFVEIVGIKKSETKRDAINVAEIVIGIVFMNSPIIPPTSSIGKNANVVVAVPAISGHRNTFIDLMAAFVRDNPSLIPSYIPSIITIAVSTRSPSEITNENKVRLFKVSPRNCKTENEIKNVSGIASPAIKPSRSPSAKNNINMIIKIVLIPFFVRVLRSFLIN